MTSSLTWNEARDRFYAGLMSERAWRQYCLDWEWTAPRHTRAHDRAYQKLGSKLYWRRINRARVRCGFTPYADET